MLGKATEMLAQPRVRVVTTRVRDAILGGWSERRVIIESDKKIRFRCSQIPGMCPRMFTISAQKAIEVSEVRDANSLWALGVGSAYHGIFQNVILPTLTGIFQGWWISPSHPNKIITGEELPGHPLGHKWIPQPDPSCSYEEMKAFDPVLQMSGKPDGVLVWGPDDVEVLELKSAGAFKKDGLDPSLGGNPEPGHVVQAHCYMMLTGLRKARIVYVVKADGKMKDVIFEHVVPWDEATVAEIRDTLTMTLKAVNEDRILPRLPVCTKKSDRRAKGCMLRETCFQMENAV